MSLVINLKIGDLFVVRNKSLKLATHEEPHEEPYWKANQFCLKFTLEKVYLTVINTTWGT